MGRRDYPSPDSVCSLSDDEEKVLQNQHFVMKGDAMSVSQESGRLVYKFPQGIWKKRSSDDLTRLVQNLDALLEQNDCFTFYFAGTHSNDVHDALGIVLQVYEDGGETVEQCKRLILEFGAELIPEQQLPQWHEGKVTPSSAPAGGNRGSDRIKRFIPFFCR